MVTATSSALINAEGTFTLSLPQSLNQDADYYLDTYVDEDGDQVCDAPPTEHAWRTKVERANGDMLRELAHHMGLEDVCSSFAGTLPDAGAGPMVSISGTLKLSDDVKDIEGLTPGQTLSAASVFLEGLPDQEARTDSSGNFTLNLNVPEQASNLAELSNRKLIMWYTLPADTNDPFKWTPSKGRFGNTKIVDLTANSTTNAGQVGLTFTKTMLVSVEDKEDKVLIGGCWIRIPKLGFQLTVTQKSDGVYLIDYLPPGNYDLVVRCSGYKPQTVSRAVSAATAKGQQDEVESISLERL
jgi:hypothetical protein